MFRDLCAGRSKLTCHLNHVANFNVKRSSNHVLSDEDRERQGTSIGAGSRGQRLVLCLQWIRAILVHRRPVAVEFWAASSAADTDFTAKLMGVRPDGVAYNILDRIVNTRQRRGSKLPPKSAVPGRAYRYRLDLGHTAVVLKAGFRVRLDISSSSFPHFARNPNTGRPAASERELRRATQTITHDAKHCSSLELPVVENLQLLQR